MRIPGLAVKLDESALHWRATRHPGVDWSPLYLAGADLAGEEKAGGDGAGASGPREATVLIRMRPGRGYPAHRHLGVEEVLVLRGGYRDDLGEHCGEHRAGDYLRYAPGSVHAPVALGRSDAPESAQNPACLLLASARGGVENLGG